jgi:MoxR-like ATPase
VTSFVGRARELAAMAAALGEARVVTLVGPAGAGRTRLATAVRESLAGFDRIGDRFERACTMLLLPDLAPEGLAELSRLDCRPPAGRIS